MLDLPASIEVETSYMDELAEADLCYTRCSKNPGHSSFIPVHRITLEHLPAAYRDLDMLACVQALADITCRLLVRNISQCRPPSYPQAPRRPAGGPPASASMVGTGWLHRVTSVPPSFSEKCQCQTCEKNCVERKDHFWKIFIRTASHVIFNQQEAQNTTCYFFFDKGGKPEVCPGVVTLTGWSIIWPEKSKDIVLLVGYTHEMELAVKLQKMVERFSHIRARIVSKYRGTSLSVFTSTDSKDHFDQNIDTKFQTCENIFQHVLGNLDPSVSTLLEITGASLGSEPEQAEWMRLVQDNTSKYLKKAEELVQSRENPMVNSIMDQLGSLGAWATQPLSSEAGALAKNVLKDIMPDLLESVSEHVLFPLGLIQDTREQDLQTLQAIENKESERRESVLDELEKLQKVVTEMLNVLPQIDCRDFEVINKCSEQIVGFIKAGKLNSYHHYLDMTLGLPNAKELDPRQSLDRMLNRCLLRPDKLDTFLVDMSESRHEFLLQVLQKRDKLSNSINLFLAVNLLTTQLRYLGQVGVQPNNLHGGNSPLATQACQRDSAASRLPGAPQPYDLDHQCPPLVVIVSHPHGCSKQVTVGYGISQNTVKTRDVTQATFDRESHMLAYSTPTCSGSSGAMVLWLGQADPNLCWAHRGSCSRLLNISSFHEEERLHIRPFPDISPNQDRSHPDNLGELFKAAMSY